MWNIRKHVGKGDYIYAVVPEHPRASRYGYVLLHRVIMENSIGRLLLKNEEVHHLDGNRKNNNIENLQIIKRGEHQRLHARLRYPQGRARKIVKCANCGVEFERFANSTAEAKGQNTIFAQDRVMGSITDLRVTRPPRFQVRVLARVFNPIFRRIAMGLYRGVMEVDILVVAGSKREANALMRQNFVEEAKNSLTKKRFEISEIFSAKWIPSDWIGCLVYNKEGKEIRPEELFPDDQEADPRQLRMF